MGNYQQQEHEYRTFLKLIVYKLMIENMRIYMVGAGLNTVDLEKNVP